jgi:hypothetical protein
MFGICVWQPAASHTTTGNFKFPDGPIKLSTRGSRSISEEFGSGKEGKLVIVKVACRTRHRQTPTPSEAVCGPYLMAAGVVRYTHFNALTRLQTQTESLNSLWIRTCNSDSKTFFLRHWFPASKYGPSVVANLLWTASSYAVCPFTV